MIASLQAWNSKYWLNVFELVWLKKLIFIHSSGFTVAPRYNEPHYDEDPVITNDIWKPSRSTVKYVETNPAITNPAITNWFWRFHAQFTPL